MYRKQRVNKRDWWVVKFLLRVVHVIHNLRVSEVDHSLQSFLEICARIMPEQRTIIRCDHKIRGTGKIIKHVVSCSDRRRKFVVAS